MMYKCHHYANFNLQYTNSGLLLSDSTKQLQIWPPSPLVDQAIYSFDAHVQYCAWRKGKFDRKKNLTYAIEYNMWTVGEMKSL